MQTSLNNFSERLVQLIKYKGFKTTNEFAKYLGYASSEKISRLLRSEENKPSVDIITDIANKFEDISLDWLLLGKGGISKVQEAGLPTESKPHEIKYLRSSAEGMQAVPLTNISAAAGTGAINEEYLDESDVVHLPNHLLKRGGNHIAVRIKGNSMSPTLQDGGFVIIRLLEHDEWDKFPNEQVGVVVDVEGNTYLKRIKNRFKQGFITLMSDNPDKVSNPNFNLQKDEIRNLWHVAWYLSAKIPNIHDQYYNRLQRLEDKYEDIQANHLQRLQERYDALERLVKGSLIK